MFNKKKLRYIMPLLVLCIVGALFIIPMLAETTTQNSDTSYEFIELPYGKSFDLKPKDIDSGTIALEDGQEAATGIMTFDGTTVTAGSKEGIRKIIFTDSDTGLKERFLVRVIDPNSTIAVVRNSGSTAIKEENIAADIAGKEGIVAVTGYVYNASELETVKTSFNVPIIRHGYDTLVLDTDKIAYTMVDALKEYTDYPNNYRIHDIRALPLISASGSFSGKTVMFGFNQASTSPLSYEGNYVGEMKLTLIKRDGTSVNFDYANSADNFTPGHYTYIKKDTTNQAKEGTIAESSGDGTFEADCRYYLTFFVKDGGEYDWDTEPNKITLQPVITRVRTGMKAQKRRHRDIVFWKDDDNKLFSDEEIGVAPKLDLGYDLHSNPASITMNQGETYQVKVTDNVGQTWVETFKGGVFSTNTKGQVIANRSPGIDVLSIGDDNHYNAVVVTVLGSTEDAYPSPVFYNPKGLRVKDNPIKDDTRPSGVVASYVKYYHDDGGSYFMSGYIQTMLINILGLNRDDISPTSYGVRSVSPAVARKALANNKWSQYTEVKLFPLVETSADKKEGVAGFSFKVSGNNLCGANSKKVSDVAIANLKFDATASLYSYAATASEYGDKKFAVKDSDGKNLAADDYIKLGEDYTLTLFVKDGGDFDLDTTSQMIITAPMLMTYKKADNLEAMRPEVLTSGDIFTAIKGKMKSKVETPKGHSVVTPGEVKKRTGLDVEGTNNESAMISTDTQKAIAKTFVKDDKTIKFDTMFPFVELDANAGDVVPIITRIRGFDLNDTDSSKLQIMEAFPNGTGKYFSYSKIAEADDGNFALVDADGNDVDTIDKSADIWAQNTDGKKVNNIGTYYLVVFIKDGGDYDVDGKEDGKVLDPVSQVSETGYTPDPDPTPTSSSGGGCNAGFGAFALLLIIPAIVRKKK